MTEVVIISVGIILVVAGIGGALIAWAVNSTVETEEQTK